MKKTFFEFNQEINGYDVYDNFGNFVPRWLLYWSKIDTIEKIKQRFKLTLRPKRNE